jgi:hypothetical protein
MPLASQVLASCSAVMQQTYKWHIRRVKLNNLQKINEELGSQNASSLILMAL